MHDVETRHLQTRGNPTTASSLWITSTVKTASEHIVSYFPSPYPWNALPKVPRSAVRAVRDGISALGWPVGWDVALSCAAQACLEANSQVCFHSHGVRMGVPSQPVYRDGVVCQFSNQQKSLAVLIEVEAELAHRVALMLLHRPPTWADRAQPTPPVLHSVLGAFVLGCMRKGVPDAALQLVSVGPTARHAFTARCPAGAVLDGSVEVDGGRYAVSVWWHADPFRDGNQKRFRRRHLRSMGSIPLRLHVIAATSTVKASTLSTWERGDAFLAEDAWTVEFRDGKLTGEVRLSAAGCPTGWCGKLLPSGDIELLDHLSQESDEPMQEPELTHQIETTGTGNTGSFGTNNTGTSDIAANVLADAPVVVRVEIASVTLTAQQWASLQPGDIVTTGHPIAKRACLRIGGIEVAWGELVDVEGELGVHIHELIESKDRTT